jgi:hypothetical protein
MKSLRPILATVLPLAFSTVACGSSPSPDATSSTSQASSGSGPIVSLEVNGDRSALTPVRVVHASPDAPAVDVYVRGLSSPVLRGLAYGDTSSTLRFVDGTYTIDLRAAPSTSRDPIAYSTGPLSVGGGKRITAIAAGLLASSDPASAFRVLPLVEGFANPGTGNAAVRVVHASPDAPTVGIDIGNDDPSSPEVPALARFADTGGAGIALPSGAALQIGIDGGGQRVTAFTTPELPAGGDLFVIATGLLADLPREAAGFDLLAVGPDGTIGFIKQNPVVYALHASPDAPAVDVFAGSSKIVTDLSFGQLSAPVQVPPGTYELEFFGASSATAPTGTPAAKKSINGLEAGERYLSIATGFLAPQGEERGFELFTRPEEFDLGDADGARVRAIHASPDAPAVDIGLAAGTTLSAVVFKDISFNQSSPVAGKSVPAAALDLGVAPTGSTSTVATFDVTTTAGSRAFVVAAGALDPSRGQGFRLIAVETNATPWVAASVLPN